MVKREREEEEEGPDGNQEALEGSASKRARPDATSSQQQEDGAAVKLEDGAAGAGPGPSSEGADEEEEDLIALPKSTSRAALKKGSECPYLDTVSRQAGGMGVLAFHVQQHMG